MTGKPRGSRKKYFIYNIYIHTKITIHTKIIREPNQRLRPTGGERASGGEGDSTKINKLKKKGSPRHSWQSHNVISPKSKEAQHTRRRDNTTHVTSTTNSLQPMRRIRGKRKLQWKLLTENVQQNIQLKARNSSQHKLSTIA